MIPTIDKLLKVQECDARLLRLQRELRDIPLHRKELESRLDGHLKAVKNAHDVTKARQLEIRTLEGEIESHKGQIRKLREQQMQLKSNKEFKAMDAEIETVQGKILVVEEKVLQAMEAIEQANAETRNSEMQLKKEQDGLRVEIDALAGRASEIEKEIKGLTDERVRLTVEVDPQWMQAYDRIFTNKKDLALFQIQNGTCGGCHMKLPPYQIHDARKQTNVVVCDHCGRMLY